MSSLSVFDWAICFGYLIVVLGLGLRFAGQQHTNEDFFVGGRRMHWLPIGLSLFAGTFSSLSFVGLPSEAAYHDYHLYLSILFIPFVVSPIIAWMFLPLYFRLGLTSAYEYVEHRFNRRLRLFCSILFIVYTIGWMGNLLNAVGVILEAVFELSPYQTAMLLIAVGLFATLYTTLGGVKAVVWTDMLQAVALGGGMIFVLWFTLSRIDGGWAAVWKAGHQHGRFEMFRTAFDANEGNVYAACAFGFFVYLTGHAVNFTAVQRYMSMPDLAAARWSLVVNGVAATLVCGLFFAVGSCLFAFYQQQGAGIEGTGVNAVDRLPDIETDTASSPDAAMTLYAQLREEGDEDQLLPRFVMKEIPVSGLMGLLLAGLFAAAMSSVDSGINSMTASIACDWMPGREMKLWQTRLLCLCFGVTAVITAVTFYFQGGNVFPLIMKIAGMFFGLMLAVFLLGMLVPWANTFGVTIGLICGHVALVLTFYLGISHWWFGAITCVPTFVVGAIASRLVMGTAGETGDRQ